MPFLSHRLTSTKKRGNHSYLELLSNERFVCTVVYSSWLLLYSSFLPCSLFLCPSSSLWNVLIAQIGHKLLAILLPQLLKYWDYRCELPCLVRETFLMKYLMGLHSATIRRHRQENPSVESAVVSFLLLHRPGFWRIASPHCGQFQLLLLYVMAEALAAEALSSLPITQTCAEFSTDQPGHSFKCF